jgi:AcrR family transcriptional regulator
LDLAARLFIDRGYHGVSMRDIASAAEVTKGAVYGHFRSKGQLLVEVIRWKIAEGDRSMDFVEAEANPLYGVAMMHEEAGRETRLLEVDAAAAARHDPEVAAGLASLYLERHARIRDAMSELADPDTAAWVLAALSAGIGMKEATGLPLPDAQRLSTTVLAAVDGLSSQQVR